MGGRFGVGGKRTPIASKFVKVSENEQKTKLSEDAGSAPCGLDYIEHLGVVG